jgi:hypothetical protein
MENKVQIAEWHSRYELLDHINTRFNKPIVIGIEAEAAKKFYLLSFIANQHKLEVAIISSGLGTLPSIIFFDDQTAVIGCDFSIHFIDIKNELMTFTCELNAAIYGFLETKNNDKIIVVHELGAECFDYNANNIWSVETDIVEDFFVNRIDKLVLKILNEPKYIVVDTDTGKIQTEVDQIG